MKTYTYAVFLRHPENGEVQHGTIEFDSDSFLCVHTLIEKMNSRKISEKLAAGYTLIAMQIVSVKPTEVKSEDNN